MAKRLCGSVLFVLVVLAGCDVSDGGEWVRITPPGPASSELSVLGSVSMVPPLQSPTDPVNSRIPFVVCQMPPAVDVKIDPQLAPWYLGDRDHVCVGEPGGHDGLKLCWGIHAAEAHAQGVADCFISMRKQLTQRATKVLGPAGWDLAKASLPDVWSRTDRQVLALVDRVSNNIADLFGGGRVAADPLCAYWSRFAEPDDVKTELLEEITGFCQATGDEVAAVLSALKRGVNVQVTNDLHLELAVMVVEKESNLEEVGDFYHCAFGK